MTSDAPDQKSKPRVDEFFNALTDQYAAAIERCFPRYREMLWALLDYLPADLEPARILELGSGTGNLSVLLAERYPNATLEMVDVSPDSLAVCRERVGEESRFRYREEDFRDLPVQPDTFDLVVSSIAVHHLRSTEKQSLFELLLRALRPGGIFAYADQHAGATTEITERHTRHWRDASMGAGSSESEWEMWMQHQRDHDHHDKTTDQMVWLQSAGFADVDCPWRYLLWTVLQARRPGGLAAE